MGATITYASSSLASDGKTITVTFTGVTGSLSPASGITSVEVRVGGTLKNLLSTATSGSTLTVTLIEIVPSTATVTFGILTGSNLTDGGGNTIVQSTGNTVTNGSAYAAGTEYIIQSHLDKITVNGLHSWNGSYYNAGGTQLDAALDATRGVGFTFEFVVNMTNARNAIEVWGIQGGASVYVDGTPHTLDGANFDYSAAAVDFSVGQHLVQIPYAEIGRVRINGGTIVSTSRRHAAFVDSLSNFTVPNEVSPIAKHGPYALDSVKLLNYQGTIFELQASNCVGVEILQRGGDSSDAIAASIDGATDVLFPTEFSGYGSTVVWTSGGRNLSSAVSHTFRWNFLQGQWLVCLKFYNGTRSTTALSISDTSIPVESATGIAAGDWIQIGMVDDVEYRKVTAVASNTLTVAALSKAHTTHCMVSPYKAAQSTPSSWTKQSYTKSLIVDGDSETQASTSVNVGSSFGTSSSPVSGLISTDPRGSWVWAADALNYEVLNYSVSGNTSANRAAVIATNLSTYARRAADVYAFMIGANDRNIVTTRTPTQYDTSVRSWMSTVTSHGGTGAKYYLVKCDLPGGTIGGYTWADYYAKLTTIAADYVALGYNVQVISITDGTVGPNTVGPPFDDGSHYSVDEQPLMGQNFATLLASAHIPHRLVNGGRCRSRLVNAGLVGAN